MKSKIKDAIIFIAGAASGAAGMFIFMKNKWQKDFEAKREEMIRYFENKKTKETPDKKPAEESEDHQVSNDDVKTAKAIIHKFNYSKISETSEKTRNDTAPILNDADYSNTPYEIDPREFGGQEMYGMVTLYLYDDGEVRTEKYELLDDEDIENYIGNLLERVADLRDADPDMDSFYCRNDRLKTDYEILIEAGRYEDMNG